MDKTLIIPTNNLSGNIGSCEVKTTSLSVDSFHTRSIAINSCTGAIVSDNTYYDWEYVYAPGVIVIILIAVGLFFRIIMD